ncbi:MAG TPA: hypothetical protein VFP89_07440 [Propionibacteriaceae bacterium]|nr:hypothetical protein [Propionibacteriaceae bacterium]
MFLAFREMRRARLRFGLLIGTVSLLVFLILAQQALQNSLITSFIGALQRQTAPVLVYSTDAQRAPLGSVIPPDLSAQIEDVAAVAESGRLGVGSFTVRSDADAGDEVESTATLFGFDRQNLGGPSPLSAGVLPRTNAEAVGSAADFAVGQQVHVVPAGGAQPVRLTVVGLIEEAQLLVTPTLFVAYPAYEAAVKATNPDARRVLPSLLAVRPVAGSSDLDLVNAINARSDRADALTRTQAAEASPGVAQVRQSFQIIFALYALVVPLVTGLFFLIITFQKVGALTLLRAVGARSGVLVRSLVIQVIVVVGGGILVGTGLYAVLTSVGLGSLTLTFSWAAVGGWAALLLVLGLLSAVVAARRMLAIDPIEATTGAQP